jgi:hypothetical protein
MIYSHFPWYCLVDIFNEGFHTLKVAASRLFRGKPRITELVVLANVLDVLALQIAANGGSRLISGSYFFGRKKFGSTKIWVLNPAWFGQHGTFAIATKITLNAYALRVSG